MMVQDIMFPVQHLIAIKLYFGLILLMKCYNLQIK
jgi:hypothetical protein